MLSAPAGRHLPALDGLRAVAVLAVLLYHHDPTWLPGGFLGVSLFFTLSGFLITTLLLGEHTTTGTIRLRTFWARRARRLLPVSLVGLVVALAVAAFIGPSEALDGVAGDARAALLNVANWHFAAKPNGYGDVLATPSTVTHYWSLAIEEQFYVVFPLLALLALRAGRRGLGALLAVITVASLLCQLGLEDANRRYLGTDARASELAIGALAALWWSSARRRPGRRVLDAAGLAAVVALAVAWATTELTSPVFGDGGFTAHAVVVAVLVIAAVGGVALPAVLGIRPLVALGTLSYGVYVLHFPLFLLLSEDRTGVDGVALLALRLLATLAAAIAVHHLVESPVRRGGALPTWQAPVGLVTALGVVLVVALALPRTVSSSELATTDAPTVVTLPPLPTTTSVVTTPSTTATTAAGAGPAGTTPATVAAAAPPTVATTLPPPPPPRILVVGDSTAIALGVGMRQWGERTGRASVDLVAFASCAMVSAGDMRLRDGWELAVVPECTTLLRDIEQQLRAQPYDAVFLTIGSMQLSDWRLPGDDTWRGIGDPVLDARYDADATAWLTQLASHGIPVLAADLPTPAWDPDVEAATTGTIKPGSGPPTMNDATRARTLNQRTAALLAAQPMAAPVPLTAAYEGGDGVIDDDLRYDGLHVAPDLVEELMDAGLYDAMALAYAEVAARAGPASLARTTWNP